MQMRFSKKLLLSLISAALLLMPLALHAETPEFYTIQTGSFTKFDAAIKQFNAVALGLTGLDGMSLDYLRIDKIGEFYAVRIGKFTGYMNTRQFLEASKAKLGGAIILKVHIKEENIVKRYGEDPAIEVPSTTDKLIIPLEPETSEDTITKYVPETDNKYELPAKAAEIIKEAPEKQESTEVLLSRKPEPDNNLDGLSKIKGKIYVSDYYSTDSGDYNLHVLTTRINLYKSEEESQGYYFAFDGKARKKIISGDLRGNVPRYSVDEAWIGYKFLGEKIRLVAGRQYIQELYNTDIDGLNIKFSFNKGLGIGVFGGFAPDKFDNSFNDKFRSVGLYGYLNTDDHQVNIGYENLTYNGQSDREYFSFRTYSKLGNNVRLNALSSVSKNQITNNFEIENANANITYSYSRDLRFNVFANYYRTIKYYESSKFYYEFADVNDNFLIDDNSQTRGGIRVDYKIAKDLKVYGAAAYQHRKLDNEDSSRFTAGIKKYDLYGFDLSGRYTYIDNYASRDNEYNIEINRNIRNKFDVSLYANYEETKLDLENAYTSGGRTYGTSLFWPITNQYYLSMFLEYLEEEKFTSTALFTQLGYKL